MLTNLKSAIQSISNDGKNIFSVEICSNKELNFHLLSSIQPMFYSVTWHFKLITTINDIIDSPAMIMAMKLSVQGKNVLMHLPCRYLTKKNVFDILTIANQHGIKNIFALLGERIENYQCSNDFKYAVDLVRYIKEVFGNTFCICVAGYPEKHPEQSNFDLDIKYLKEKVDAGADFIITQVIFDVETFKLFYIKCRENNINVPIIPGLYIITSYIKMLTMAKICSVMIPKKTLHYFKSIKDDNNQALQTYTEDLINNLLTNKDCPVNGIHLFSLNNIELVYNLSKNVPLLNG